MPDPPANIRWWLALAPHWSAEERREVSGGETSDYVAIVPPGGDALLRLTTFDPVESKLSARKWLSLVALANRAKGRSVVKVQCGDFTGFATHFAAAGRSIRGWALCAGTVPLDVTYCCNSKDAGRDDDIVDAMLSTLSFRGSMPLPANRAENDVEP